MTLFILAWKQIRKEKFIYFCQVLAVAAVLIPVLIIWGLKHGIISSMKEQLLGNPATLELRQSQSLDINEKHIETIRSWPETQFVVAMPDINGISVRAMRKPAQQSTMEDHADAIPCDLKVSGSGDPLMQKSHCSPPSEGDVVLSTRLAEGLNVDLGDTITLSVSRNQNTQLWAQHFRISGILPPWASSRSELYGSRQLVDFIEEYKRAGTGKPGAPAEVNFNAYQALILDRNTTRTQGENLAKQSHKSLFELSSKDGHLPANTPFISRPGLKFGGTELNRLIEIAEQADEPFKAYPWNAPLRVKLAGKDYLLRNQDYLFQGSATLCEAPPELYINPASDAGGAAMLTIDTPDGKSQLYCDLIKDKNVPLGELWASPQLVALAHQAGQMLISWDYRAGALRYPRARSLGLRLYSTGLEETEILHQKMHELGLPCNARLASIRQLLELERSFNIIFLIISSCAILGGGLALAFNLFNAIERHRKDYALLQLLGVGKFSMMMLPLIESILIIPMSIVLALGVFFVASAIVSRAFAQYTDADTICKLTGEHVIYLVGISVVIAFFASLASAFRVLCISPSEIIRES